MAIIRGKLIRSRPHRFRRVISGSKRMDETGYLLRSRSNEERLRAALRDSRAGKGMQFAVDELRAELRVAGQE